MRFTALFMIIFSLHVSAAAVSQSVTFSGKNVSLQRVFAAIKEQTGYLVFCNSELLKSFRPVTVNARQTDLHEFLNDALKGQGLGYYVEEKTIVIIPKTPSRDLLLNDNRAIVLVVPQVVVGVVVDENKVPLSGVSVYNKNNKKGTSTSTLGRFSIEVAEGDVLVFSFVGYGSNEVKVEHLKARSVYKDGIMQMTLPSVQLTRVEEKLDDIIVSGYSSRKINELTGSVQKVSGDELRKSVTTPNALSMLKGKTTGLYITETSGLAGATGQVIERGVASIPTPTNSYLGPLIVVDGIITNYTSLQDAVNTADIEDITILKDASSTAIYGSRAAQGVILVNTKKGKKGTLTANLNLQYGVIEPVRNIRFMNTSELISFMDQQMKRYWEQTPAIQATFPDVNQFIKERKVYSDDDTKNNFDWERAIYSNGDFRNTELSLSSGTEKTRFYGSVAWFKENGALYDNAFDRKSLRLNIDQTVTQKFSVGFNLSAILDKTTRRNGIPELYMIQPFQNPYDANGNYVDSIPVKASNNYGPAVTTWTQNFLGETKFDNTSLTNVQNYLGSIRLKYEITPWLSVQSSNSVNFMNTSVNSYLDPRSYSGKYGGYPYLFTAANPILPNGTLNIQDTRYLDYLTSNTINFRKSFGAHTWSALAGQEWGKRTIENYAMDLYNLLPGERNVGAARGMGSPIYLAYITPASPPAIPSGNFQERGTFSGFEQLDYNYDQRYFGSASVRTDATTNFGREKRYGTFYSISGGWEISRESFMKDVNVIDNLKLRAVYGTSGRDLGNGYLNTTFYTNTAASTYGGMTNVGANISQLANESISWETMYNTNIGIDAKIFKRIDVTLDVYHKRSSGLLQNVTLTSAQGALTQYQNVGEIINKGLEIMLNTHNVKGKDFNWFTNFNISFNKNHLSKLYQDSLLDGNSRAFYRKLGEDFNVIKAIPFAGINPENGNMQHYNADANGKMVVIDGIGNTADLRNWQTVGSATPKFFGGFTNTFTYKQFTLNVEWWFQYGNYVMMSLVNNFQSAGAPRLGRNNVVFGDNQRIWQGAGDTDANYPDVFSTNANAWNALTFRSSRLWGDASHMRLRNVRLGYDLPKNVLRKISLNTVSAYVSVDNLLVLKRKDFVGADPEGAVISTNTAFGGVGTAFANPRRYVAGLSIAF